MNFVGKILFSTRTMGFMLLLYAFSMAVATFVENDYGTPVAKALIYNSWWFELIMVILVLNFIGNIKRYQLIQRKKWPLLVFHLAFILIFVGGAITRYISFEGSMHIREGESNNEIISDASFFKVQITNGEEALAYKDVPVILTSRQVPFYLKPFQKEYAAEYDFMGQRLKMRVLDYIPRAQDSLVASSTGKNILHLVTLIEGKRENKYIPSGSVQLIQNMLVSYNKETPGAVNIQEEAGNLVINSPVGGGYMIMASQEKGELQAEQKQPFHLRSLYTLGSLTFVIPQAPSKGEIIHFEGDKRTHENEADLVKLELSTNNTTDTVSFYGGKGITSFQHQSEIGGLTVSIGYGSKIYYTPFELKLRKFKMEKYPGSNSPASYSSDLAIVEKQSETPYTIYMNHVLDHQGYRFFQSSFDPDEKGTVLSVNHDFWGTTTTYIGYTFLFLAMFVTLFWKGTRFSKLNEQLSALSKQKASLLLLLFMPFGASYAQEIDMHGPSRGDQLLKSDEQGHQHQHNHVHTHDSAVQSENRPDLSMPVPSKIQDPAQFAASVKLSKSHAANFGSLLVQNFDGRIEPINTLALEILRKLHHKDQFYELDANQFLLSVSTQPFDWAQVPLIKVNAKGGPELLNRVKADPKGYTSLLNLITLKDNKATFVLEDEYQQAFAKKPADQNSYDKELIELNDKLQVMQYLISGQYLRVLPIPNDPNNTWVAWGSEHANHNTDVKNPFAAYLKEVIYAQTTQNWQQADQQLEKLKSLQKEIGKEIIPSEAKINWEIRYNSWNIFFKLMIAYALLGSLILALAFVKLFSEARFVSRLISFLLVVVTIAASLQALGLGIRWYISGHEPWSNGYEAVMFISWIGILSGLILYRNSNAFIPAAGCLIAVILMGFAHGGSQMNPQITPLVPVLKSYWLMIHVAIITSSYGFFGLSALIGLVTLILHIIKNKKIALKVSASLNELTIVNEMSLTVGLFLLTIGTFLGGIWANESWGRYWSWDPKETWAFISIILYAFVLHVRLIPGLKSKFLFNLLSLLSFSSVIMTYFGVNYYLSGLHSYAKGDPVPIPSWVYITVTSIFAIAFISYFRYKQFGKSSNESHPVGRKTTFEHA
ncbi:MULTISPECIES: c-type cytochrome biogenesis protein CcsB [Olivibacter]|uniref:C-type cytochrome biogenesis protein CcsB n=1 Tax=Olivibacter jilunii TaxID=985016 RepID=A0ABW6B292_9SPHI|nr:c-type cytochrome biogenesis protein CcsB [Olivibacter sp. UJ_SKK_5.1]MDX3916702.1 c-type cytochrome biogenesis protein CcsB [Pseudosphingobacterium sp.]